MSGSGTVHDAFTTCRLDLPVETWGVQIEHDSQGEPVVTRYDHGDLVLLRQDEAGPLGIGRRGDWGMVERVGRLGALTVRLAGYSRPRSAPIVRLTDLPSGAVLPCDRRGVPLRLHRVPPLRP